jgi:hypothetical protein
MSLNGRMLDEPRVVHLDVGGGFPIHCYVHLFVEWIKEVVLIVI